MAEKHETSEWREFGSELESSLGHSIEASSSFRAKKKCLKPSSLDEDDFMNLLHGSDPVKIELNRLQNDVRGINSFTLLFCFFFR